MDNQLPSGRTLRHGLPRWRFESTRRTEETSPGFCQFFVSVEDEIIEAFGEKPAIRLRKRYKDRGELTSSPMRRLMLAAQRRKERQHYKDRKLLMNYEKQRAEMRTNMGLNPVLG
jgi:preprotein translocase subunit SecA